MRISGCSSDVCSSDLQSGPRRQRERDRADRHGPPRASQRRGRAAEGIPGRQDRHGFRHRAAAVHPDLRASYQMTAADLPSAAIPAKAPAMKRLLPLTLLALAACATGADAPYRPVGAFEYGAMGPDPFWMVAIGDDQIVLLIGPPGGRADGENLSKSYPCVLPRGADGSRRWRSAGGR